ncbi:hypothetical protein R6Q59_023866 [Mikania micrantha]
MGDHRADDLFMHVDLNQEPLVGLSSPSLPMASPPGFGFVSGKHVTPPRAIEDRFRVLEAASASARNPKSDVGLLGMAWQDATLSKATRQASRLSGEKKGAPAYARTQYGYFWH